jgi:CBS domain-containing protein
VVDEQNQLVGLLTHESFRQKSRPVDLFRLRFVNEVMTRRVICADHDVSIFAIARLMAGNRVSSIMHDCANTAMAKNSRWYCK